MASPRFVFACLFPAVAPLKPGCPRSSSRPGRDLGDGAAASGHHDEDGELPEAAGAEEGSDRRGEPRHAWQGASSSALSPPQVCRTPADGSCLCLWPAGVHQAGLPQQAVRERSAAEDVLPGTNHSFTPFTLLLQKTKHRNIYAPQSQNRIALLPLFFPSFPSPSSFFIPPSLNFSFLLFNICLWCFLCFFFLVFFSFLFYLIFIFVLLIYPCLLL